MNRTGEIGFPKSTFSLDKGDSYESHHTLKHKLSDGQMSHESEIEEALPLPPSKTRKLTDQNLAPSCFCEKKGRKCEKHTKFEPTIQTMLDLLEDQVQVLNDDEQRIANNMEFIDKSL